MNKGIYQVKHLLKIFLTAAIIGAPFAAYSGDLTVNISGIKRATGNVMIALWDSPEGFPSKVNANERVQAQRIKATVGTVSVVFSDIKPGTYAVSTYHDANVNNKLDKSLFGAPTELYGFSNNAVGMFGPPKFKKTTFEMEVSDLSIDIALVGGE